LKATFDFADLTPDAQQRLRIEPASFTVPLVINDVPLGTGTLVRIDSFLGILTAEHVVNHPEVPELALKRPGSKLGLAISEQSHRVTFPGDFLSICAAKRISDKEGPDIAFIAIPASEGPVEQITATKSFFNITHNVEERIVESQSEKGVSVVVGMPQKLHEVKFDDPHFEKTVGLIGATLITKPGVYRMREDGWDDIVTVYTESNIPFAGDKLGGVSGGGLWKAIFKLNEDGTADVDHMTLSGVVFYDERPGNDEIHLRAHGPPSIYRRIVEMVRAELT